VVDVTEPHAPVRSDALAPTASEYLHVLRRRKRAVIPTLLLVPLASVLLSLSRSDVYQGSAEVLLTSSDLPAALTGAVDTSGAAQPDRIVATQADLARVPEVARRTLAAVGLHRRSPDALLHASTVSPKPNTDLLEIDVRDGSPRLAVALANAYADQFTKYKLEVDSAGLTDALRSVSEQITSLEQSGETRGPTYTSLLRARQQLSTTAALGPSRAVVVREADRAQQVEPRPKRALLLGAGLGIVLAVGLAFGLEGLDTRARSDAEIWQRLGLPLLARLPSIQRRTWGKRRAPDWLPLPGRSTAAPPVRPTPPIVVHPQGPLADAFRVLRTNVDLVNVDRGARLIMVTSALPDEERPVVSANLAIAFARAGRHVTLVDLDLRNPSLSRIFGVRPEPGVTDVALGTARRARALAALPVGPVATNGGAPNGNGSSAAAARLEVLVAGHPPPEGSEFVSTQGFFELLAGLRQRADLVVLDAPPMLASGDAIALGAQVEGLIVVVRRDEVRRQTLDELRRVLDASPAAKLGVVVLGAEQLRPQRRQGRQRSLAAARSARDVVARRVESRRAAGAAASAARSGKR
jgi:Mrp family chromosome partitioning ATPase/capsular polysaccharide biosynthesis protein